MNAMLQPDHSSNGASAATSTRCRLCNVKLKQTDHLAVCLCADCGRHPQGRAILSRHTVAQSQGFTPAERSLVRSVNSVMPPRQLLSVINERRSADSVGPATMDQLRELIADLVPDGAAPAGDWASLRRMLAAARRDGTLAQVDEQIVDDFAVVFSLSPAQWTHLKDVLLGGG